MASTPSVNRNLRWILASQLMFGFGWSLFLLNPKFLAGTLHAPPDVIGRVASMGGLTGLLTVPFAAFALDRLGRRIFFQLGALLIVLVSWGFMHVHAVTVLVYLLQGCLTASFVLAYNASAALLTDYVPRERMGQAIGWVGGANVFMNAVSTMVAEPLAASYGWQAVFMLGIAAGCAAFAMSFSLRESPTRLKPMAAGGAKAPLNPLLFAVLLVATLMGAVFIAVFAFVQPYALSLGAERVRGFYMGFTTAAVAGRIFLGGLGDRLGRRGVSIGMLFGYCACAFALRHLNPNALFFYGLAFGAAHGILYPTLNALVLEVLPVDRRGLGLVLYNGAFNCGSSLGSLGWGTLAKQRGYSSVYAVASLTAAVAALILLAVRSPAPLEAERAEG
jgi:MFS family permease